MAKDAESDVSRFRVAYALNVFLSRNKKKYQRNKELGIEDILLDHSFDKISSRTGLRVATISAIFNGKVDSKFSTISHILNSLGFSYSQFGRMLDSVTDAEAQEYIKNHRYSAEI